MKYDINNPRPTPSQDRLRELMDYDPATGVLNWKKHVNRTDLNGRPCGCKRNRDGYISVNVDGHKYSAHRLIYKWMTGNEAVIIDHVNGQTSDNRWSNLKSVSHQENNLNAGLLSNNKSGSCGVFYHPAQNRYHASVRIDKRSIHLGSFKTKEEAEAARKAANKLLGFSDRHGCAENLHKGET